MGRKPGLRKGKAPALLRQRSLRLASLTDGIVNEWFTNADVVSEGLTREEKGARVYYGTTNVLFATALFGDAPFDLVGDLIGADPHLRLRVTRLAHREASARAGGSFATAHLEMASSKTSRGIEIAVDVVARLFENQKTADE